MATNKESFVFYKDWWNAIGELPQEIRGEVCESIIRYAFGETVAGLGNMAAMAMRFITPQIDRDRVKYEARCEKNRENGALGGRPRPDAAKPNASPQNRMQPNGCDENRTLTDDSDENRTGSDNENENGNVNENSNVNAGESVCEDAASAHACTPAPTPEEKELFNRFQSWLTVYAPTVLLFTDPLQPDQFMWLYNTYGGARLKQCAADIHNKEAYMSNRNALNTFKSWIKRVKM